MKIYLNAYFDNNIGDDLMIKGILREFPNYKFYAVCNSSVVKHSFKKYENLYFIDSLEEKKLYKKIDVYLNLGGSIFQFNKITSYYTFLQRYLKAAKAKRNGAKVCTLGSNLGPFSLPFSKWLFKKELKKHDLITVRDKESYDFLIQKCDFSDAYYFDDIVFELIETFTEIGEYSPTTNRKTLGITAYRSLNKPEYNLQYNVGMATIINEVLKEQTIRKIKIFAFDTERENDLSSAHHILKLVDEKYKNRVEIVAYLGDEKKFLEEFQSCCLHLSTRFHSLILSRIYSIKSIPIFYSNKMFNFSKDKNIDDFLIPFEEVNKEHQITKILNLIKNSNDLNKTNQYEFTVGHILTFKQKLM